MGESFFDRITYILRVSKKPTEEEIIENIRIVMIGIFIMGVIGFAISLFFKYVLGNLSK